MSNAEAKAEAILTALRQDPDILWAVAKGLRVAGPWEQTAEEWWQRPSPWDDGYNVATMRIEQRFQVGGTKLSDGWHWSQFDQCGEEIAGKGSFTDVQECRAACDAYLESQGWVLIDRLRALPETPEWLEPVESEMKPTKPKGNSGALAGVTAAMKNFSNVLKGL